ncbi:hypothetical protein [Streptomyces sp. NPDC047042]|uniref:hypothetical protein n=1 Tax=Streptomyces sp. NPDC047042 TaxID=3154807 RepID=UPI0034118359
MNDPYAMPNGVLRNKLGITTTSCSRQRRRTSPGRASSCSPFCPARNLVPYAGEVFGRLASSCRLRDLPRQEFVIQLAALYGDMNVLHPFRERALARRSRRWRQTSRAVRTVIRRPVQFRYPLSAVSS